MARFEVSAKVLHYRIYGDHPDNYEASFSLYVEGDRGQLYGLNGRQFYKHAPGLIKDMMAYAGIKTVEAYVLEDHAALIERAWAMNTIFRCASEPISQA